MQAKAGRLYFEMPGNKSWSRWVGYVCSGTSVEDGTTGRFLILTASHCVYDDAHKAFARNVLFIPDQANTTGSGTDRDCTNDPYGCWVPTFGVVDVEWSNKTFPNNVAWDYAFYVVNGTGSHVGNGSGGALDAGESMAIQFLKPTTGVRTYALGYSYDVDPLFRYCAEDMSTDGAYDWWLGSCELSGGSSGGPWVQLMDTSTGGGPIISVNSYGYTNAPGMAGPKLSGTSAACVYAAATSTPFEAVSSEAGYAGAIVTCP